MPNIKLFKTTVLMLFSVLVLYLLEIKFYLTWTVWWYDMVLHFLAGVAVGMLLLILLRKVVNIENISLLRILLITIAGTFIVGIVWEIYELYFGFTALSDGMIYITDTMSDLILDIVGALLAGLYVNKSSAV